MPQIQSAELPKTPAKVDVNLDLVCQYCSGGRVVIQGQFDHRLPIQAWCDNPYCGDLDDDEKGREHWIKIDKDGNFNRHEAPPQHILDYIAERQTEQK